MQNDEQAIRELVAEWLRASKAGETDQVLSLMSDDVVFLVCGHAPMDKAGFAAGQAALKDVEIDGTSNIEEVKVLGDWAYIRTHLSIVITPKSGGDSTKRAGNTLSILRKQDGKWLLVRDANMLAVV
ncbi:MAG TPA: SgcJ/EcaC family oxidoreductase [Pyrinomonadaceae bacterium]|jgi:uncharacterized protein (TIGR02246 family)|nr:SgcJ/EcaC family oxidoreductase [Pyrinomonadaceae bacterium]